MSKKIESESAKPPVRKKRNMPQTIDGKIPPEKMSRLITENLKWFKQPPVKSDEECLQRLVDFFQYYADNGGIPTVEKMALALGTATQHLWEWEQGTKGSARRDIIKRAKGILASIDADLALSGLINPVVYIFRGKNYYGMKDTQDVVVQAKNIFGDGVSREEIERRLMEDTTQPTVEATFTTAPATVSDEPATIADPPATIANEGNK